MTCDVYYTSYVREMMKEHGFEEVDRKLLAMRLDENPLAGRVFDAKFPSILALEHIILSNNKKKYVFYAFIPNGDIQIFGADMVIVLGVTASGTLSGGGLEPESVLRLLEMVAELTRCVLG